MTPAQSWSLVGGGILLALTFLVFAFRIRSRERLLELLPTVKTQGVFIGFVELKGTAELPQPLRSFLAEQPCVYYTWEVSEHWSREVQETYTDSEGHTRTRTKTESGWTPVGGGGEMLDFFLRDDTGVILINPEKAKIEPVSLVQEVCGPGDPLYYGKGPAGSISNSDHRRQFVEEAILVGAELYVVGQSREREDVVALEIAYDPKAPMFLISTRGEKAVESGMGWASWGLALLGLLVAEAATFFARAGGPDLPVRELVLSGAGFALAWGIGWIWMVYNSLVGFRQRVRQAASLVDVELQRRHDLIPTLVAAVQGYRDYEAKLQEELAVLRTQGGATRPGEPGPDPVALVPCVRTITERYPELKASASFLKLQKSLADTEQRIALARGYLNGIAQGYNTSLEVVPDRFVAALAGLRPQAYFTAGGFERVPVDVDLGRSRPPRAVDRKGS
ncbi:MAG TPA: LemA family protein [Planctomycetota bacterium]|nr:LemA family protein [Planctomycetota bacterium]